MTRRTWLFAGIAPVAVLALATIGFADDAFERHDNDDRGSSRVERGFALAPVHLNLRHKNRAQVGLGSYIVNAQGACRTPPTTSPAERRSVHSSRETSPRTPTAIRRA